MYIKGRKSDKVKRKKNDVVVVVQKNKKKGLLLFKKLRITKFNFRASSSFQVLKSQNSRKLKIVWVNITNRPNKIKFVANESKPI